MRNVPARLIVVGALAMMALFATACDGDDDDAGPTGTSPGASPTAEATAPPGTEVDPCTLRMSMEGQPLSQGPSFELDDDVAWQMCIGGAAAGSSEKYLFGTDDGGATWTLLSMTTLGEPTPEPGVGALPNGNAAEALFFVDGESGWLGLSSPGQNLFRSDDGGVSWEPVDGPPAGVPVTAIDFTDAQNGTLTTPDGEWTTSDGGETWTPPA